MCVTRALILGICLTAVPAGATAQMIPVPSRAPAGWELNFTFQDPQRITLTLPGDDYPTTFWYMLYRVENDTGEDIPFFPSVELVTQSLDVIVGGDQISPSVYDAIRERHRTTNPFLMEPRRVTGTLLQGEDNSRNSVVVFRDFDPADREFTLYFAGLSGEIRRVANPSFDRDKPESADNPRFFTVRKTLAITYRLPGDKDTRALAEPVRISREWIMR